MFYLSVFAIERFVWYECWAGLSLQYILHAATNQSGRSTKVVALFLLQTLVAIWYDYFNSMIQSKWNQIFVTKFSSIYLAIGEKRLVFRLSFVNLQRAKNGTHMFGVKYRCVCCINLIKSHAWYHASLITFPNECLLCNKKMLLNLVANM